MVMIPWNADKRLGNLPAGQWPFNLQIKPVFHQDGGTACPADCGNHALQGQSPAASATPDVFSMTAMASVSRTLIPPPVRVLIVLMALILALQGLVELLRKPHELRPIRADQAAQLQRLFDHHDYRWPPQGKVPPLGILSLPPDLDTLDVDQKKSLFFRTLLPLVLAENARLRERRRFAHDALNRLETLTGSEGRRLQRLARQYGAEGALDAPATRTTLLRRVDIIPPALVLAQAANESGWGTSRFAVEANNLFGIWTYEASAGLTPGERNVDARHYVRAYPSLQRAVRDYLHNLNIGHAYGALRRQRAAMRARGEPLDPLVLAGALERYSERGVDYVTEIRGMIRSNDLNRPGQLHLAQ
ncbi:glucosaminidase domain-containing protein [Thiohalobacter thiocyanaticus]|nr:glucosaminidase domain-containing protein [Thiohalobacter thiocyanaticus]